MLVLIKKRFNNLLLFFFLALAISCNINDLDFNDINVPNYKGRTAVPLGEVTYTIKELIEQLDDSTISIEESGNFFLTVVYRDTSLFTDVEDFISFGNIVNNDNLNPNLSLPVSPIDTIVRFSQPFEFDFQPSEGEIVDSLTYASGTVTLAVQSQFSSDLDYTLKIIDFTNTLTGDTLVFAGNVQGNGSSESSQDLQDFKTIFNRVGGRNQFSLEFEGALDVKTGESINVNDFLSLTLTISNPEFKNLFGFFGANETSIQDQSLKLDFFKDIDPLGLEFNNPEIIVNIENAFGIPVGLSFGGITAFNEDGDVVVLAGKIDSTQFVRAPEIEDIGSSARSEFSINNDNSNLREMLNIAPDSIVLAITGTSNYRNENAERSNFLTDSSFLQTIVEVRMPLEVKLDGFTRSFTFIISDFSFDQADSVSIRLQTINELPLSGIMSLDILDELDTVIYRIPNTIILQSPEVNSIDRTVEPLYNESIITLDREGINAFANAEKIKLTLVIDSYNAPEGTFVRIFSDYELLIKLGAIANINADI